MSTEVNYGHRHVPAIIEEKARESPHKVLMSIARSSNMTDGFDDLSYGRFAQAIDRCAFWMERAVGRSNDYTTPKVIFANLPRYDLRGAILILAAPKTGHQIYWPQPFGKADEIITQLRKMHVDTFFGPEAPSDLVAEILKAYPMRRFDIPSSSKWLFAQYDPTAAVYEYERDADKVFDRAWSISQTSGTTGPPKAIVIRNGAVACMDNYQRLPQLGYRPTYWSKLTGKRVFSTFGWYQYGGYMTSLVLPVLFDYVSVTAPQVLEWSPEFVNDVHLHGNVQVSILYPAVCIDIARHLDMLVNLKRLDLILMGGSSIPRWVGDAISDNVALAQLYGCTEGNIFPIEVPLSRAEWDYIRFPAPFGVSFEPYKSLGNRFYEIVVRRNGVLQPFEGCFANDSSLDVFHVGDLFEKHPVDLNLWRPAGRIIDLIHFSSGRILNPVVIEDNLANIPGVAMAMICGLSSTNNCKLVVLITPVDYVASDEGDAKTFLGDIWSDIVHVFEVQGPAWTRRMLDSEYFLVTSPGDEGIQRTGGKWNVNRSRTLEKYGSWIRERFGTLTTDDIRKDRPCHIFSHSSSL